MDQLTEPPVIGSVLPAVEMRVWADTPIELTNTKTHSARLGSHLGRMIKPVLRVKVDTIDVSLAFLIARR
ncbi:MAG: hypothetical protein R2818_15935 [Flavobacteriales bacterium]